MAEELMRLEEASIGYALPLMRPVSFTLRAGEFWGLVGPNGAGKTTFIRTILGLLKPIAGIRRVLRTNLRFGYVPQRHALSRDYPLSALDVALMDRASRLIPPRRPSDFDRSRAIEELRRFGLGDGLHARYASLSGGQQQRVLMARALAADPDVLVLDEPASGIDVLGGADILSLLRGMNSRGLTLIMVSHSLPETVSVVSHLGLINREIHLFETGPIGEMATSQSLSRLFGRRVEVMGSGSRIHIDVPTEAA